MFLLDTNAVSEARKVLSGRANPGFAEWLVSTSAIQYYLSTISVFELEMGVLLMENRDARQGASLRIWLDKQVKPTFVGRILALDNEIAVCAAKLHVPKPASDRDAFIAATAMVHNLTLVTRNIRDFKRFPDLLLVCPWS